MKTADSQSKDPFESNEVPYITLYAFTIMHKYTLDIWMSWLLMASENNESLILQL